MTPPDDRERARDWPYTLGGLDFPAHTPTDAVLGWWWPPLLPTRHGRAPHLNLTLGLTTLQGRDDEPADLAGYGPIPADLARHITTRHPRCRAPGCTRPSTHCDLDHHVPHNQGGPTCEHKQLPP